MMRHNKNRKRQAKKAAKKKAAKKKAVRKLAKKKVVKKVVRQVPKKAKKAPLKKPNRRVYRRQNMNLKKVQDMGTIDLSILEANHIGDYKILLTFSDGVQKIVDFGPFLETTKAEYLHKYREPKNFQAFKLENRNIVWGDDWDLIFPIEQLHEGKIQLPDITHEHSYSPTWLQNNN